MIPGHDGGRNVVFVVEKDGVKYVLRLSPMEDRKEEDFLAEVEFVHYLAQHGAPVADVVPSVNGKLVESYTSKKTAFISLFEYAKGKLLWENQYRYREGVPIEEYFYNTGKTLGVIHRLSKQYEPVHRRMDYFDKYNKEYIDRLIPEKYADLKKAICHKLDMFSELPRDKKDYGLVHFDFSDGNYHIDFDTGDITVFDFENSLYCWYMYDLANLWIYGEGWCRFIRKKADKKAFWQHYFDTILEGYRSETDVSEELLSRLPLFIDMVLIENIVDEFECCARAGEKIDFKDIKAKAKCLIKGIPFEG
ncbi:MAG: phosphotransferase [Clostridiales bacterium]|nr:phosphotransferase [Clostridiales bacterium]